MAHDVVVIGGGNAALCAALAAREGGASVLVLEKAPESERGGNSFFTAGGFRFAHHGLEDLRRDVIPDLSDEEARTIDVPAYTEDQYYDDLMRVTEGRSDLDLAQHLVQRSQPTVMWMRDQGHPLDPHVRPAVLQGGRPPPLLGRPQPRGGGRRAGPGRWRSSSARPRWASRCASRCRRTS